METLLQDEYYEFILNNKECTKDKMIVFNILNDFTDRIGLSQEWYQIDGDIKEEIIQSWIDIVNKEI